MGTEERSKSTEKSRILTKDLYRHSVPSVHRSFAPAKSACNEKTFRGGLRVGMPSCSAAKFCYWKKILDMVHRLPSNKGIIR
jgi:hypothetical protein